MPRTRSSKATVKCWGLRPVGSSRNPAERSTPTRTRVSTEAHQRRLLRQFVDRNVARREHRDPIAAVDREVPRRVVAQDHRIESAAPNHNDVVIAEVIARAEVSMLGHRLPALLREERHQETLRLASKWSRGGA